MLNMFFPAPHDAKDAISKFAGFIGMVASVALAVHLILPVSPALSASSQTLVSIIIGLMVGWLSFAVQLKK
ncbi:MAG: hypothetical protein EB110_01015 [Betaproteobacteria bacterium]|jgi:hypothetical protein|nr:hypothetical protein [Betaproteobacteria bacterium]